MSDLNLILLMKKDFNKRRVISITEINLDNPKNEKIYKIIFKYNPESQKWDNLISLFNTNIIGKLKTFEDLSFEKFSKIINIYYDIFKTISKIDKIIVEELVSFFHKISYYSMRSVHLLEDFWGNWKKMRGLNF